MENFGNPIPSQAYLVASLIVGDLGGTNAIRGRFSNKKDGVKSFFSAVDWAYQASKEDLVILAESDCTDSKLINDMLRIYAQRPPIGARFKAGVESIKASQAQPDSIQAFVSSDDLARWLSVNRPNLFMGQLPKSGNDLAGCLKDPDMTMVRTDKDRAKTDPASSPV